MFSFRSELFEDRATAIEALAAKGFDWFVHYSAIDLLHDLYGLEVCGIPEELDAKRILKIMESTFSEWTCTRISYHDGSRDQGWKVEIYRRPQEDGNWETA